MENYSHNLAQSILNRRNVDGITVIINLCCAETLQSLLQKIRCGHGLWKISFLQVHHVGIRESYSVVRKPRGKQGNMHLKPSVLMKFYSVSIVWLLEEGISALSSPMCPPVDRCPCLCWIFTNISDV